nr:MAG TPA: hypothetical protein [Caudoviricetes sp.]DAU68191.1 MAG TPA: hypothetical protein [Caudoviricetes sp.]
MSQLLTIPFTLKICVHRYREPVCRIGGTLDRSLFFLPFFRRKFDKNGENKGILQARSVSGLWACI